MLSLQEILSVPTAPSPDELQCDVWDDENRLNYSQDGTRLLDAENFPEEVSVHHGCKVICDGVFAFRDYMADVPAGSEVPLEERCSFLAEIDLPATLTHIGVEAFAECGAMERIHLPESLLLIGDAAFLDCWSLEQLRVPDSVRVIGASAFMGCINMRTLILGAGVEYIGPDALHDCESLRKILVPKGMADRYAALLPKKFTKRIKEK